MKVWKPNDPLTTLFFQCQDVFVMYDIKVYCGSLQQKLTRFDFLSSMTFGSFSIDYYRLWITRRQENYFRNKQRGRYGPTLTKQNYTDHSKWNVHFVLSISRTNSAMKDTEKKNPLKTRKENVNNTTNTNIVSLGQDAIYDWGETNGRLRIRTFKFHVN